MVGAINPNSTHNLDAQIHAAQTADFQVAPGQPVPREASSRLNATPAASSLGAVTPNSHNSSKLSGVSIMGIVLGSIAFFVICVALLYVVARRTRIKHKQTALITQPYSTNVMSPMSPGNSDYPPLFSPYNPAIPDYPLGFPQSPPYGQQYVHVFSKAFSATRD
jgi:hypothetical protein